MFKKSKENKMDELFKEIGKATLPMLIPNWIFGIGIIEYPLGHPHRVISFVYTATIIIVYCSTSIYIYPYLIMYLNGAFEITKGLYLITFYTNFPITILTMILGWHRYRVSNILLYLKLLAKYII